MQTPPDIHLLLAKQMYEAAIPFNATRHYSDKLDTLNNTIWRAAQAISRHLKHVCAAVGSDFYHESEGYFTETSRQQAAFHTQDLSSATAEMQKLYSLLANTETVEEARAKLNAAAAQKALTFSVESLIKEFEILQREWGTNITFEQNGKISLCTGEFDLTYNGTVVHFPGFYINLFTQRMQLGEIPPRICNGELPIIFITEVGGGNSAASNEEYIHPHVESGLLCLGEAAAGVSDALKNGHLSDLMRLLNNLLHTYNHSGPYLSLNQWESEPACCSICGEDIEDDEDSVTLENGSLAHEGCATWVPEREVYIDRNQLYECSVCGQRHVIEDRQNTACAACAALLRSEQEAADRGAYICPICRTLYEPSEISSKVVIGYRDYGCTHCCQITETTIIVPSRNCVYAYPGVDHTRNITLVPVRPTPQTRTMTNCACGAYVPEHTLRECRYTGVSCCPECDPYGWNLGVEFFNNVFYLDAELLRKFEELDDFTKDFLSYQSLSQARGELPLAQVEEGDVFPIAETPLSVLGVFRAIMQNTQPMGGNRLLLKEKVAVWNDIAARGGLTLLIPREEVTHDISVTKTWQIAAAEGQQWAVDLRQAHGCND